MKHDFLTQPLRDHIRSRMAMSNAEYGSAIQRFKRAARFHPDFWRGAATVALCAGIGVMLAMGV